MEVKKMPFTEWNGRPVHQITLKNDHGMKITCMEYACVISEILVPDREGQMENVVLGFDTLEEYLNYSPYFGAVVGRIAGRTKNATFKLEGQTYHLQKNNGENNLHSGDEGFGKKVWDSTLIQDDEKVGVIFTYTSPDGESGFPGTVEMSVTYVLNNENQLQITTEGQSDKTTLLNVTNHSYFNLSGDLKRDILDHALRIRSEKFAELEDDLLPTGETIEVTNSPFDFNESKKIGRDIREDHVQLQRAGGYDHPFFLKENHDQEICLKDELSGRKLVVETDQPCVVVYTSNTLSDGFNIRGVASRKHLGVCLETQGPPDAIHHPQFPSVVLPKGKQYHTTTTFTFSVIQ